MKQFKVLAISIITVFTLLNPIKTYADENLADGQLHEAEATAYCWSGKPTATGVYPKEKRTVAFNPKYYGCCMLIWEYDKNIPSHQGEFLGYFLIEDTGSEAIENGSVVDVFIYDEQACWDFGRKDIVYQIVEGGKG